MIFGHHDASTEASRVFSNFRISWQLLENSSSVSFPVGWERLIKLCTMHTNGRLRVVHEPIRWQPYVLLINKSLQGIKITSHQPKNVSGLQIVKQKQSSILIRVHSVVYFLLVKIHHHGCPLRRPPAAGFPSTSCWHRLEVLRSAAAGDPPKCCVWALAAGGSVPSYAMGSRVFLQVLLNQVTPGKCVSYCVLVVYRLPCL